MVLTVSSIRIVELFVKSGQLKKPDQDLETLGSPCRFCGATEYAVRLTVWGPHEDPREVLVPAP